MFINKRFPVCACTHTDTHTCLPLEDRTAPWINLSKHCLSRSGLPHERLCNKNPVFFTCTISSLGLVLKRNFLPSASSTVKREVRVCLQESRATMQEAGVIREPHEARRIRPGGNFMWQWPHLLSLLTASPERMGGLFSENGYPEEVLSQ